MDQYKFEGLYVCGYEDGFIGLVKGRTMFDGSDFFVVEWTDGRVTLVGDVETAFFKTMAQASEAMRAAT